MRLLGDVCSTLTSERSKHQIKDDITRARYAHALDAATRELAADESRLWRLALRAAFASAFSGDQAIRKLIQPRAGVGKCLRRGQNGEIMTLHSGIGWDEDMTLRLSIENVDRLPDGGPLRIEVKGRGLDLGRDAHLDWTLPGSEPKHLEQALRNSVSRRRILAARHLDQRHFRQWRAVPPRRPVSASRRRPLEHWALHHRGFGRGDSRRSRTRRRRTRSCRQRTARPPTCGARSGAAATRRIGTRTRHRSGRRRPPDFLDFAAYLEPAAHSGATRSLARRR